MENGASPAAKNVYDLDSIHLLGIVRNMVEQGCLDNGKKISPAPRFFIGAAANPFAPPYDYRPLRLAKKIAAGARFAQTQLIYNVERSREYMSRVRDLGLDQQFYILAGIGPLKSAEQAKYMATQVAGMEVPQAVDDRMVKTPKAAQAEERIRICVEVAEEVREIPGVAGIHIMAVHWADAVPEIVNRLQLAPRPTASTEK